MLESCPTCGNRLVERDAIISAIRNSKAPIFLYKEARLLFMGEDIVRLGGRQCRVMELLMVRPDPPVPGRTFNAISNQQLAKGLGFDEPKVFLKNSQSRSYGLGRYLSPINDKLRSTNWHIINIWGYGYRLKRRDEP